MELLAKETVSEDDLAEAIGTLTLDGTEHKFAFFEVSLLPHDLIDDWRREMSADRAKDSVMLLASLYLRRYPYDESERIAQPAAPAVPTPAPGESEQ